MKESIISSLEFGWDLGINNHKEDPNLAELHSKFKWNSAIKNIQGHIKSLNFGYKTNLSKEGIDYFNALAALKNKNTILFSKNKESLEKSLKENIVAEDI